ncbi:MAG: hypothetical protein Q9167_001661 [Letrouitia subvulpina]
MPLSPRSRWILLPLVLALGAVSLYFLRLHINHEARTIPESPKEDKPQGPIYKDIHREVAPPLPEYFPLAAGANGPDDLPPVPSWNRPPVKHVPESTRLYLGFTRFWPLLQQVVVSYIAAGWPPEDIYVIENTGTFDANKRGLLTVQNPFYLDYHRLTRVFGVNVITTPSLQTFAQLQNLYLSKAIRDNLTHYFWSHMDIAVTSHEDRQDPFKSFYMRAVDVVRQTQSPDYQEKWAQHFFAYDWLTLVNVEAFAAIGGWDSMVGYYGTDCDMYSRLAMNDYKSPIADAGMIYDVTTSVSDLEIFFRRVPKNKSKAADSTKDKEQKQRRDTSISRAGSNNSSIPPLNDDYLSGTEEDELGGRGFLELKETLNQIQEDKKSDKYRNSWQLRQNGGEGEPYYVDPDGFEKALQMIIEVGTKVNEEKWGHKGCDIKKAGLKEGDQWKVEHDSTFDSKLRR